MLGLHWLPSFRTRRPLEARAGAWMDGSKHYRTGLHTWASSAATMWRAEAGACQVVASMTATPVSSPAKALHNLWHKRFGLRSARHGAVQCHSRSIYGTSAHTPVFSMLVSEQSLFLPDALLISSGHYNLERVFLIASAIRVPLSVTGEDGILSSLEAERAE